MAQTPQFDTQELKTLAIPYWRSRRAVDEDNPVIWDGRNTMCTLGGRLLKRPGTADMVIGDRNALPVTDGRIDRMFSLEVAEEPRARFIVASIYNRSTGRWFLRYICLNDPGPSAPSWQDVPGNVNGINSSTQPHVAVSARSKLYVRGVPHPSSSAKFCGVVLSPSPDNPYRLQVDYWGIPDPEQPARIRGAITRLTESVTASSTTLKVESTADFPSPPFPIIVGFEEMLVTARTQNTFTVQRGYNETEASAHSAYTVVLWREFTASESDVRAVTGYVYSYSYKSRTGHISSRAPIAESPTNMPSATGPFKSLCPVILVPGHPDTQLVPKIVIWRTTDGGGIFYRLAEIDNTGASQIPYIDKDGAEGAGFDMPVLDDDLSGRETAPSTVSNSPPPPVAYPKTMGVDDPEPSTPLAVYANRIWFAIGNVLFYSALEENTSGNPEESFPSGTTGNYFRLADPVVSVAATTDYLAVFTTRSIYQVIGHTRETFSVRLLASGVGMHPAFPYAVCSYRDSIYFFSSSHQIIAVRGDNLRTISYPVFADFEGASPIDYNLEIHPFSYRDNDLLIALFGHRNGWRRISEYPSVYISYPSQSVYDFNLSDVLRIDFWNTVWDIPAVSAVRSRTRFLDQEFLILANYSYDLDKSILVTPSPHTGGDLLPDGQIRPFSCSFTLSPLRVPAGNHLNSLRVPMQYPILSHITLVWRVMSPTLLPGWSAQSTYVEPRLYYCLEEIPDVPEPVPFGSYGKPGGWQPGWTFNWGIYPTFASADYPLKRPFHTHPGSSFVEGVHWVDKSARRVMIRVELPESLSRMEILAIQASWLPTYGI